MSNYNRYENIVSLEEEADRCIALFSKFEFTIAYLKKKDIEKNCQDEKCVHFILKFDGYLPLSFSFNRFLINHGSNNTNNDGQTRMHRPRAR